MALRHALSPFVQTSVDHPAKTLHVSRLILDTPALHTTLRRWTDSDGRESLADLVDQAFSYLAPALDLTATGGGRRLDATK
ncbi:hypothetical protein ACTMTJ_22295 [Phytohabitans sp. LJ34]|uniref:hypothetical protein n=1 Tax=Phytohabitans sp. LJ34 TaxID=3452217 RepID=UPI003F8AF792